MTAEISTETMTDSTPTTVTAPKAKHANSRLNVVTTERRHVPKPSGKPDPTAHLSAADVEALARELDALRQEVLGSRGAKDAAYIRRLIHVQRKLELGMPHPDQLDAEIGQRTDLVRVEQLLQDQAAFGRTNFDH